MTPTALRDYAEAMEQAEHAGRPIVYLASRYDRRRELLGYAEELHYAGYMVSSRWVFGLHEDEALWLGDECPPEAERHAVEDCEDLMAAHVVVAFTERSDSIYCRGGRHVELGLALAAEKVVITVGPRENVFCWLPQVQQVDTWEQAVELLEQLS